MEKVAFTTKLGKEQLQKLKAISKMTHIPQSILVREWIEEGITQMVKSKEAVKNDDFLTKEAEVRGSLSRLQIYEEI